MNKQEPKEITPVRVSMTPDEIAAAEHRLQELKLELAEIEVTAAKFKNQAAIEAGIERACRTIILQIQKN